MMVSYTASRESLDPVLREMEEFAGALCTDEVEKGGFTLVCEKKTKGL